MCKSPYTKKLHVLQRVNARKGSCRIRNGLSVESSMMSYPYNSKQCLSLIMTFWTLSKLRMKISSINRKHSSTYHNTATTQSSLTTSQLANKTQIIITDYNTDTASKQVSTERIATNYLIKNSFAILWKPSLLFKASLHETGEYHVFTKYHQIWNALPDNVVSASSVDSFRHQVKTFLGSSIFLLSALQSTLKYYLKSHRMTDWLIDWFVLAFRCQ